jgi:hypothetical protein
VPFLNAFFKPCTFIISGCTPIAQNALCHYFFS